VGDDTVLSHFYCCFYDDTVLLQFYRCFYRVIIIIVVVDAIGGAPIITYYMCEKLWYWSRRDVRTQQLLLILLH